MFYIISCLLISYLNYLVMWILNYLPYYNAQIKKKVIIEQLLWVTMCDGELHQAFASTYCGTDRDWFERAGLCRPGLWFHFD